MKVKELREELAKLDGELDVFCYSENDALVKNPQSVFCIEYVSKSTITTSRSPDGFPLINFSGKEEAAILEITADF